MGHRERMPKLNDKIQTAAKFQNESLGIGPLYACANCQLCWQAMGLRPCSRLSGVVSMHERDTVPDSAMDHGRVRAHVTMGPGRVPVGFVDVRGSRRRWSFGCIAILRTNVMGPEERVWVGNVLTCRFRWPSGCVAVLRTNVMGPLRGV